MLLGLIPSELLPRLGFEKVSIGIISSSFLILIVVIWTATYISRVITGNMTFIQQRRRYRDKYEKILGKQVESKFNLLTDEEKLVILKDMEDK
tara:strand:+ start:3141 stop:3419 length:279 start_codon:yes stop_codon:yes gene_type:complete